MNARRVDPNIAQLSGVEPRTPYRKCVNMGSCTQVFEKILVFVAVVESSEKTYVFGNLHSDAYVFR